MWAEVILNTEQTFFDGKFVKKCNTFSQLFLSMDPHCSAFFFFLSPLLYLISPLFSVLSTLLSLIFYFVQIKKLIFCTYVQLFS